MDYCIAHMKVTKEVHDEIQNKIESELKLLLLLKKLSIKSVKESHFEISNFISISDDLSNQVASAFIK